MEGFDWKRRLNTLPYCKHISGVKYIVALPYTKTNTIVPLSGHTYGDILMSCSHSHVEKRKSIFLLYRAK